VNDLRAWVKALFYTRNEVDQRQAAHTVLTAAHGATGAVVGTTNAQTLTNKTLTSPVITGSTGAWVALTLNTAGNWANYGGGVVQDAEYKKVGDLVFLRGLVVRSSGVDTTIATLPAGYRPPRYLHIAVASFGAYGQVNIDAAGNILFSVGSASDWVSLNNICFSVV